MIVDGTQDIQRTEQESIGIRWVDDDLEPHEDFVGFYAVDETTGREFANCVKDCLMRYQLPLEKLRRQTYDGATNMSGAYKLSSLKHSHWHITSTAQLTAPI